MIIRNSIREPMALPKGDESHLLVQESNDKKLGRIVTRQCSNRVTYQLSINSESNKPIFLCCWEKPQLKDLVQVFFSVCDARDMAKLNGIPAESSALVQNCLNEISREEAAYQLSIQPPKPPVDHIDPVKPKTPVKPVIKQKPVSIRTLTKNKTYSIRTEADIDAFLNEMRKSLIAQLDGNTIIRLS